MPGDIEQELDHLEQLSVGQLLPIYRQLFGQASSSRHKRHLIRAIAWGRQAQREGRLSPRALRRAAQLVEPTDLKLPTTTGATRQQARPAGRPALIPGTVLRRSYKGQTIQVRVREDGFEFQGQVFRTLSAVAKSITGSHWSGHRFFGLSRASSRKKTT